MLRCPWVEPASRKCRASNTAAHKINAFTGGTCNSLLIHLAPPSKPQKALTPYAHNVKARSFRSVVKLSYITGRTKLTTVILGGNQSRIGTVLGKPYCQKSG